MNIKIVIGANFGDEGKGLMTDYFSSKTRIGIMSRDSIVVRFNGGAQAGHTVVTPDGKRHIFNHFGSGTLAELPTYLSKHFIVNPIVFKREHAELKSLGCLPITYVDSACLVTTPFDILINQIVESYRGDKKHGSCGLGINETIKRSDGLQELNVSDFNDLDFVRKTLTRIRDIYVPTRLKDLGIDIIDVDIEMIRIINSSYLIDNYINDIKFFMENTYCVESDFLKSYDDVIFEGAQGLLLDQNHDYFPHVTPSNTGLKNIVEILNEIGLTHEDIEVTYVTRCYMTRHGAGPLESELENKPYANIIDMTNIPNPYQGTLRFGWLDIDLLQKSIYNDLKYFNAECIKCQQSLAITCLDQVQGEKFEYSIDHAYFTAETEEELISEIWGAIPSHIYLSHGSTRNDIQDVIEDV